MEGWNDPPKILNPSGKLKINLNKRIAFPLSKGGVEESSANNSLSELPPMIPSASSTADDSSEAQNNNTEHEELFDSNAEKEKVLKTFEKYYEKLNPTVRTKLKTLETDWEKCDIQLQKLLGELAEFVESNDSKEAASVQRKLIMKGCNHQFMLGIRQMIMTMDNSE